MQPPNIDVADEARQRGLIFPPDLLEAVPKVLFEADAGFVPRDYNRVFDNRGVHWRLFRWGSAPKSDIRHDIADRPAHAA